MTDFCSARYSGFELRLSYSFPRLYGGEVTMSFMLPGDRDCINGRLFPHSIMTSWHLEVLRPPKLRKGWKVVMSLTPALSSPIFVAAVPAPTHCDAVRRGPVPPA